MPETCANPRPGPRAGPFLAGGRGCGAEAGGAGTGASASAGGGAPGPFDSIKVGAILAIRRLEKLSGTRTRSLHLDIWSPRGLIPCLKVAVTAESKGSDSARRVCRVVQAPKAVKKRPVPKHFVCGVRESASRRAQRPLSHVAFFASHHQIGCTRSCNVSNVSERPKVNDSV